MVSRSTTDRLHEYLLTAFALSLCVAAAIAWVAFFGGYARGADDADRKARAALALAAAAKPAAVAVAPAPRDARPLTYAAGVERAKETGRPLVVYVGTTGPVIPGTVTAAAPSLPGFEGPPKVVVSYPVGDHLRYDAELPAGALPADVKKAADAAAGKIEPRGKPAPKPLDWDA